MYRYCADVCDLFNFSSGSNLAVYVGCNTLKVLHHWNFEKHKQYKVGRIMTRIILSELYKFKLPELFCWTSNGKRYWKILKQALNNNLTQNKKVTVFIIANSLTFKVYLRMRCEIYFIFFWFPFSKLHKLRIWKILLQQTFMHNNTFTHIVLHKLLISI